MNNSNFTVDFAFIAITSLSFVGSIATVQPPIQSSMQYQNQVVTLAEIIILFPLLYRCIISV